MQALRSGSLDVAYAAEEEGYLLALDQPIGDEPQPRAKPAAMVTREMIRIVYHGRDTP